VRTRKKDNVDEARAEAARLVAVEDNFKHHSAEAHEETVESM